LSPISIK
jgi:hypothetical protein